MPGAWLAMTPSGGLVPADESSREAVAKIGQGEIIKTSFRKSRNYENHKRFFAFINTTFDMQEHFTEFESYRRWLVMKAGRFTACVAPNGNTMFFPESIAFDQMDEDQFQSLFSDCINVFLRELGKGMTEDELMRVIEFS